MSQADAAGKTVQQKKGNWVKITKEPDGTDVVDPNTGKLSFYYEGLSFSLH